MALTKERVLDKIEIVQGVMMQIRYKDIVKEDGKEIASSYFREVIGPLDSKEGKHLTIQSIANILHTPEVVAQYQAEAEARLISN